jgi:Ca2+/Na+ antiporter
MMNWLLLFIPAAVGLELLAPERYLLIFIASSLSILPLAWWMGRATEELADGLGEAIGGLLNATFGNAAELIIALTALHAGLHDIVKASIAGSIIGNILLVLGCRHVCRRPASSRTTLQSGWRPFAGDDAHVGGDCVNPPGGLSSRSEYENRRAQPTQRLDLRRSPSRIFA